VTSPATADTARVIEGFTILAALPKSVLEAAASLGADPAAVAAEAGFDTADLADPDARVPVELDLRLWEVLSRRGDGLAIGARLGPSSIGVVGYAAQHGATVGDAIAILDRYRTVVHVDVVPRPERRTTPAGDRLVFARPVPPPFARLREPVLAQAAAIVALLRALAGRELHAVWVALPLPRPADPRPVEAFFACPVAWGAPALEVAFDAAVLDLPLPRSDERLSGYLARRADELLATLPDDARWADRARREIGLLLPEGEPRLATVARRLAVSDRTLHRRLADDGTSFAALVEEARRERAMLLLGDAHLSASEVAFLLGYAEPAGFFRAFKRWTGETPQAWRSRANAAPT
jgi:AraC-like DNA-binding protein